LIDSLRNAALAQQFSIFQPASQGTAQEVSIANARLQVSISTHGARPTLMLLKEYLTYHQKPLLLADPSRAAAAAVSKATGTNIPLI
jgi:YidC/Oxa1 family membrane protein insertase